MSVPKNDPFIPSATHLPIQRHALNIQQAAEATGLPSWTIREAVLRGKLRAHKAGRFNLILPADLTAWLESLPTVERSIAKSFTDEGLGGGRAA